MEIFKKSLDRFLCVWDDLGIVNPAFAQDIGLSDA